MSIHPSPNFPLRASDQADVIRLFIDLMRDHHRAEQAADTGEPLPSRHVPHHLWPADERPDLD